MKVQRERERERERERARARDRQRERNAVAESHIRGASESSGRDGHQSRHILFLIWKCPIPTPHHRIRDRSPQIFGMQKTAKRRFIQQGFSKCDHSAVGHNRHGLTPKRSSDLFRSRDVRPPIASLSLRTSLSKSRDSKYGPNWGI
jgi:hypothetical protein